MILPYDDAGDGPPVVFLHAGICDRTMWRDHVPALIEAGYRVLAPDLPGFGEAHPAAGPSAPWEDLHQTIEHAGATPAVLVGNSFGGAVALRLAVTAPALVRGLVLVAAPPVDFEPGPELRAAWEAEEAALEAGDLDGAVAAVLDAWLPVGAPPALRERVGAMQRRTFELQRDAPESEEGPDPLEEDPGRLAGVDVPALVAAGTRDMPDFITGADALAAALPRATRVDLEDTGHLAPLEDPAAFRELLLAFLADLG